MHVLLQWFCSSVLLCALCFCALCFQPVLRRLRQVARVVLHGDVVIEWQVDALVDDKALVAWLYKLL